MDNCSEIPLAPAECINTDGGFRCACDNYLGFTLSSNGTTCEGEPYIIIIMDNILHLYLTPSLGFFSHLSTHNDIDVDECEEGLHPCTQDCVNTPGSFMCACSEGFALDQDGITCSGTATVIFILIHLYLEEASLFIFVNRHRRM